MEEDKPSEFGFNTFSKVEKEINGTEYCVAYPADKGNLSKEELSAWESANKDMRKLQFANTKEEADNILKSFNENNMSLKSLLERNILKENVDDDHYVTGSDSKYIKLLSAVETDWGKDSDLYDDLESAIVGGSFNQIKHVLANYEVEEDYLSLIESKVNESNISQLKSNKRAWNAAETIIRGDDRKAEAAQDYLDSLPSDVSKPYFDYIEQRQGGEDIFEAASPEATQNKLMTDIRVSVDKILRFLAAAARHNKKDKALHTELTRFNSIKGLLDKSNFESVVSGFTFESKTK